MMKLNWYFTGPQLGELSLLEPIHLRDSIHTLEANPIVTHSYCSMCSFAFSTTPSRYNVKRFWCVAHNKKCLRSLQEAKGHGHI